MIDWIEFGKVSAERDENLSDYFYDSGVLTHVVKSRLNFLVLGRKGAGKTAVFTRFAEDFEKYLELSDSSLALSLENYDWNIHELLLSEGKAPALAYIDSWKFIIFVEALYTIEYLGHDTKFSKPLSKVIKSIYGNGAPTIGEILGKKLLSLSKFKLPGGSLDMDADKLDGLSVSSGEVEFKEFSASKSMQESLNDNIGRLVPFLERGLKKHFEECGRRIFVSFDRLDEAWLIDSRSKVRPMLSGLVGACESITQSLDGALRPVVFLREDIFSDLELNDKNKLRTDCGSILAWSHEELNRLILQRINFFASKFDKESLNHVNDLFDRKEMRQRRRPFDYLLFRTMMRPRDLISFLNLIRADMISRRENPFEEQEVNSEKLECQSIYNVEKDYSEWLKEELLDEWSVQYPNLKRLFDVFQSIGSTVFSKDTFIEEARKVGLPAGTIDITSYLRFLYSNSIIGFKVGQSNQWKFRCFFPTTGFNEVEQYKIHDGLTGALNLKEPRGN